MEKQPKTSLGNSTPIQRTSAAFRGFPELRSNVLYCPKQFFSVVLPNSSVNCIRLVAYMLRKTLGWVDKFGEPTQEQLQFSHRELEIAASVSHSRLQEAISAALQARFIRCVERAQIQTHGIRAKSAVYELCWDENHYTDSLDDFQGFYLQSSYVDEAGQNRLGRKNIPNVFFDYLIRNENRRLIRVVGTLLWYSIDWGKGGERKVTVRKALRDLVELTKLEQSNVVRALNEAEEKEYVERIERGVFDLSGKKQSSTTVYGIRWTKDFTYTQEGLPVQVSGERSQKATQPILVNAPKKPHETSRETLPKSHTEKSAGRTQKATQNAPKKPHEERTQKATIRITKSTISKTSVNNSSSFDSPAPLFAVAAKEVIARLASEGFSKPDAERLASIAPGEDILRQIELLPFRNASKNKLGLLRRAIEENWPAPETLLKTTDVSSSPGNLFAASFYAGYHGNQDAPVSKPSESDASAAQAFLERLLAIEAGNTQIPDFGREFGSFVTKKHSEKRTSFPALQPALRQFGDEFFTKFKLAAQAKKQSRLREYQAAHLERFRSSYLDYLENAFSRHEKESSELFQEFSAEEEESLITIRRNRFGLDTEKLVREHQSRTAWLERFERALCLSEVAHDVLDFWTWDQKLNTEKVNQEEL